MSGVRFNAALFIKTDEKLLLCQAGKPDASFQVFKNNLCY